MKVAGLLKTTSPDAETTVFIKLLVHFYKDYNKLQTRNDLSVSTKACPILNFFV